MTIPQNKWPRYRGQCLLFALLTITRAHSVVKKRRKFASLDTIRREKIWLAYGSLGRRSRRTIAVFVAFSWLGLLVSCILHVCVWISKVFFICCLGSRQHCYSFFHLTAPGLALSPHFPANVPQILFLDILFFSFWWILHSSCMTGPFLVTGTGWQGIH